MGEMGALRKCDRQPLGKRNNNPAVLYFKYVFTRKYTAGLLYSSLKICEACVEIIGPLEKGILPLNAARSWCGAVREAVAV